LKLVFATRNNGKLKELRKLLPLEGFEVLGLGQMVDVPEIEETGATFAENATVKARSVMHYTQAPTIADDSGLEVDALDGAPGIYSARFAGPGATDEERVALLLSRLADVPLERRTARFRCVVAFVDPLRIDHVELCAGSCEGRIIFEPRGRGGFGYDPIFFAPQLGKTFAEADIEEKNKISHRGQAMAKMASFLKTYKGGGFGGKSR
jgi:XTP/dITP diphosphohydrolase